MRHDFLNVSLPTLIAASPLMGHELEDRTTIRQGQHAALAQSLLDETSVPLRSGSQRELFCVAPLDILVSQSGGHKQFHLLELNGTGIGGVTNLPDESIAAMLDSLAECTGGIVEQDGVVLLAVSGKESKSSPRSNRLMHEKLLFLDAMQRGMRDKFGCGAVRNLEQLAAGGAAPRTHQPTAVIGYMKDLLRDLQLDDDGRLSLYGRPVQGAVNDRFCRNLLSTFNDQVDLRHFRALNRCFVAGSDKGVAYGLMNDYIAANPSPALPDAVRHMHAHCRESLIENVLDWLLAGRQVVIKPHGTGLGHGIEFFFDPSEPVDQIVARIDDSLQQTEEFYNLPGGALPYTLCEFVDAQRVQAPGHPLHGHKYELRVVVYRDQSELKAVPSIAKIARERCDTPVAGQGPARRALINNITASGDTQKVCGTDYMLPLCNHQTLEMLDLTVEDLQRLNQIATGYVRHVLDQVEDAPQRLGLPAAPTSVHPAIMRQAELLAA